MNIIRKAATAAVALTITLTGAVLTTAPLTFAGSPLVASYTGSWSTSRPRLTLPGQAALKIAGRAGTGLTQS